MGGVYQRLFLLPAMDFENFRKNFDPRATEQRFTDRAQLVRAAVT
jgi:hypothetical protein